MKLRPLYEDHEPKFFMESGKELEHTLNKRFSLNLPDCSAVLDSQNNNNLMDTNELSWLQKFAQENQKICNSGLFDQTPAVQTREVAPMNDMKFSFNMNYQNEERKKEERMENNVKQTKMYERCESQIRQYSAKKIGKNNQETDNILGQIQITQNINVRPRKDSLVGSIKKNPKPKSQNIQQISQYNRETSDKPSHSKLNQMSEKLNKVLHVDRSAYIQQLTNKQNAKIFSEISMSNLLSSASHKNMINNNIFENTLRQHRRTRDFSKASIDIKPTINIENTQRAINPIYESTSCFEIIFNKLDKSQTGKLSKANLTLQLIHEDLRLIFGGIFICIKYKQKAYNKRQFVQACQKIIDELNSSEAIQVLREFEQKQRKDIEGKKLYDRSNSSFKASFFQEKQPTNQSFIEKHSIFSLKDTKNNKSNAQLCKCGSNVDCGKFEQIFDESSTHGKISNQSTNKYNESLKVVKTKEKYFDQNIDFMKKSYQKDYQNYKKQRLLEQRQSKTPKEKKSYNASRSIHQDSYQKRSVNISESVLQSHKKSIQSLQKLNERMQFCLSTNMLAEHSRSGLSREDSLTFDELIKHV